MATRGIARYATLNGIKKSNDTKTGELVMGKNVTSYNMISAYNKAHSAIAQIKDIETYLSARQLVNEVYKNKEYIDASTVNELLGSLRSAREIVQLENDRAYERLNEELKASKLSLYEGETGYNANKSSEYEARLRLACRNKPNAIIDLRTREYLESGNINMVIAAINASENNHLIAKFIPQNTEQYLNKCKSKEQLSWEKSKAEKEVELKGKVKKVYTDGFNLTTLERLHPMRNVAEE